MSTRRSVASAPLESTAFAEDVEYYLSLHPRQLPSRFLYDDLGSALFEAICELPWYRITRTERGLLQRHAAEILARGAPLGALVELGPGQGEKIAILVDAAPDAGRGLTVHLIDVSATALAAATRRLASWPRLSVVAHQVDYDVGLEAAHRIGTRGRPMVLCLGSNIGNFDPPDAANLLAHIRATLAVGDTLLLGTDLRKPEHELRLAYDDPLGVSAAFNRNLLQRLNSELGADFDLGAFRHRAVWNDAESRVEMHLVSTRAQTVRVPAAHLEVALAEGEPIWTESSYKYTPDDVRKMLAQADFDIARQWIADGYALTLARATTVNLR
jgi:dimethylhistidine N-methyltransferase